jgi:hypothetical protein
MNEDPLLADDPYVRRCRACGSGYVILRKHVCAGPPWDLMLHSSPEETEPDTPAGSGAPIRDR